jgi:hypothetical protein
MVRNCITKYLHNLNKNDINMNQYQWISTTWINCIYVFELNIFLLFVCCV